MPAVPLQRSQRPLILPSVTAIVRAPAVIEGQAPVSADNGKAATYVTEIDALRCIAMTAVMLLHVGLLPFGWTGVWLFFVISGFAITTSLITDSHLGLPRRTILGHFYLKRALRILPLYVVYLLAIGVYASWFLLDGFWPALPFLSTFTYNLAIALGSPVIAAPGAVQLWSISGEEQFYLLFPFLFLFLHRRSFILALIGILLCSPLARAWLAASGEPEALIDTARRIFFFTPVHFDSFAIGALIALLTHGRPVRRAIGYSALVVGAGAVIVYVTTYAVLQTASNGYFGPDSFHNILSGRVAGDYREVFAFSAIWMAAAGLILAVLARVPVVLALCRPRIFRTVGRLSYGGYVYHGLVMDALSRFWPALTGGSIAHRLGLFAVLFSTSMALAFASYHLLERPFLRLKPRRPRVTPEDCANLQSA